MTRNNKHSRSLLTLLLTVLLLGGAGCGLPAPEAQAVGPALPIDGDWEYVYLNQVVKVKISHGVITVEGQKKILMARNVRPISPSKYACESVFIKYGWFDSYIPAEITVFSEREMQMEIFAVPEKGFNGEITMLRRVEQTRTQTATHVIQDRAAVEVEFDAGEKQVETTSERVTIPKGTVIRARKSRTIEREISFHRETNVGGTVGTSVKLETLLTAEIRAEIRAQLTKKFGQDFTQTQVTEVEVELNGNVNQQYVLVWYDIVRTGRIKFSDGPGAREHQFELKVWSELRVEAVGQ